MIWLNKQTVGNDNGTQRLLISGGAINVYANLGNTPVQITDGGLIAKIPTSVGDPSMELFRGNENDLGDMIWDRIDSGIVSVDTAYYDTTDYTYIFPYYFYYDIAGNTDVQWTNCDYFMYDPNPTTITASMPTNLSTDSTAAWIAFPTLNSLSSLYASSPQAFTTMQVVPIGMQAVIVGLRDEGNGNYSSSFNPITITSNMNVPMTFAPTTLQQFNDDVNGL